MKQHIGLIAGSGNLPTEIIVNNPDCKFYVAAITDQQINIEQNNYDLKYFNIGKIGKILQYFQQNNIKDLVIIGSVKRPNFSELKLDILGSLLLTKILANKFLGDDKLLSIVIDFLKQKQFNIISAKDLLPDSLKLTTNHILSQRQKDDISLGQNILNQLSDFDIGQSIIIENGYVIAIEAAEGTDALINRSFLLKKEQSKPSGILVKMAKINQNKYIDLPTIGPNTIINLYENKFQGLAIDSKNTIISNHQQTWHLLKKYNLFLQIF